MSSTPIHSLALDQGTFSTRAVVFDGEGRTVTESQQPISLNRIDSHHVEQDASELLDSVRRVTRQALDFCHSRGLPVGQAGVATQRSSIVAWQPSDGRALSPVLSWQDTRAARWLAQLKEQAEFIQQRTGLRLSAHYGASKMRWLLDHNQPVQAAFQQRDCVITPLASYILFHLSEAINIQIDIANASRTLLCNLFDRNWDTELIELFGLSEDLLPICRPIRYDYGEIGDSGVPILAVNGDQTAALYANGEPDPTALRVNLGTGAFVLCSADSGTIQSAAFKASRLLAGIANSDSESARLYVEGTVNGAGAAIDWFARQYDILDIEQRLSVIKPREHRIIFINAVGNMGSPYWREDIGPTFVDEDHQPIEPTTELALLAVLESIVFLLQANIDHMLALRPELVRIDTGGGLSNVSLLNQMLANLSGLPVLQSSQSEATARGIAWLAMADHAHWRDDSTQRFYQPRPDVSLQRRYRRFRDYLQRV